MSGDIICNGLEIVNSKVVTGLVSSDVSLFISILIICGLIFGLAALTFGTTNEEKAEVVCAVLCILCILCFITAIATGTICGKYSCNEYTVIIRDDVDIVELNQKYDIVEQDVNVLTIREKETWCERPE